MTVGGRRRDGPLRAGPGRKSSAWRAAAFLVAWGVVLLLWPWITPDVVQVGGLGRFGAALAVLGLLMSLPYGLDWLRGRLAEPEPEPRETVQVREVEGSGGSTYVVLTQPKPAVEEASDSSPRTVRVKEVGAGWFVAYMLFWRAPVTLGDLLLTGVWNLVGKVSGRAEDRHLLRAGSRETTITWPDAEDRRAHDF